MSAPWWLDQQRAVVAALDARLARYGTAPFRGLLNHARHVLADPTFRARLVTVSRYDMPAAMAYLRESLPGMP